VYSTLILSVIKSKTSQVFSSLQVYQLIFMTSSTSRNAGKFRPNLMSSQGRSLEIVKNPSQEPQISTPNSLWPNSRSTTPQEYQTFFELRVEELYSRKLKLSLTWESKHYTVGSSNFLWLECRSTIPHEAQTFFDLRVEALYQARSTFITPIQNQHMYNLPCLPPYKKRNRSTGYWWQGREILKSTVIHNPG
jgi:hypothetical protein